MRPNKHQDGHLSLRQGMRRNDVGCSSSCNLTYTRRGEGNCRMEVSDRLFVHHLSLTNHTVPGGFLWLTPS